MPNRFAFVIPALNEELSIGRVVTAVSAHGLPIVVDDGSTDATARLAREAGADVVSHLKNRGYDAALENGLLRAISLGMTHAVVLDGDGQHADVVVGAFRELLDKHDIDLVLGVRDHFQRFAEGVFAAVGRMRWGVADPLCGIKGYRLARLKTLGPFNTFPSVGTEAAIRLILGGASFRQVPVNVMPRQGISRFGVGWRPNVKILKAMLGALRLR